MESGSSAGREAVRRARIYLRAGVDCVFPIRLADEVMGELVDRVEGPVNVVGAGGSPIARLAQLGIKRISFAGVLMNEVSRVYATKLSEIAGELAALP